MKVVFLDKPRRHNFKNAVVVIGVFDGVHRGHQQLLKKTIAEAKKIKGTSIVLTFWPHPEQVLRPGSNLPLLVSLSYRLKLLAAIGINVCFVVPFTKQFSHLTPEKFAKKYLIDMIAPNKVIVGYDFRFGENREGDFELFKNIGQRHGFRVNVMHAVKGNKKIISSTLIRSLIAEGNLKKAAGLLGRPVSIMGTVQRGASRGRILKFPTANIDPDHEILPPQGVYAVRVILNEKKFSGMANIGTRPTFTPANKKINLEVHIFNFHKKIYGKDIIVEFIQKIRDEKVFSSQEKLVAQLSFDQKVARRILRS